MNSLLGGGIFSLIGLGFLVPCLRQVRRLRTLQQHARILSGEIIGYETVATTDADGMSSTYQCPRVLVRSGAAEVIIVGGVGTNLANDPIGSKVKVISSKPDLSDAQISSFMELWLPTLIVGLIGVVFFAGGVAIALFGG